MKVCEIFDSIDGEGIRTGFPVTFVRLHGCNLNCNYCDSRYACEGDDYFYASVDQIVDESMRGRNLHRVTLTGGEPLIQEDVLDLIDRLSVENEVNIETNGSIDIGMLDDLKCDRDKIIVTMDYKCKGSGMSDKMITDNFAKLRKNDVLKFVVSDILDLNEMKDIIQKHDISCNIFVSPVFGRIEPREIAEYIVKNKITQCRVQVQLHKVIWDPNERGV